MMRSPIAEQTASKTFTTGRLDIHLYTLDYGTYRETLACFPGTYADNLTLPAGDLDSAMASKAINHAMTQNEQVWEEIMELAMWDDSGDHMVPWFSPAAE